MYFLGFDFENNGDTEDKVFPKDGYYDDWIVKLTPAKYHNAKRIICEDLGTIGDFDFNDIVFDVSPLGEYWNPELQKVVYSEAVITVRAAGGTLPVFVGGVNVKESLGVPEHVMVNTDAVGGMDDVPPAIFRIPWPATDNLRDIEVLVKTNEAVCALTAPIGDAPQKLCVPADFVWPSERVNIKTVYENFPNVGWENSISEGDGTGDDEVSEPTEPEDPSDTPEDPKEDATDYGVLIAAEDLVDGQPIPAKYFENVGESCTITVVGNNVNINLRRFDWNPNINIKTEQGEVVSISLTGDLLTLAKNGELYCTFNYVESTIAIYVKQD